MTRKAESGIVNVWSNRRGAGAKNWRFTGFYGHLETCKRKDSWELLRRLNSQLALPWICARDFNEILFDFEESGLRGRDRYQMEAFRKVLGDCNLSNMGYIGNCFTWCNNRRNAVVRESLDRWLANDEWQGLFSLASCFHLTSTTSDHASILVDCLGSKRTPSAVTQRNERMYQFEALWLRDELCEQVVTNTWERVGGDDPVLRLQTAISQRARTNWLLDGDQNTNFFHATASQRHRKKHIAGIEDGNGGWLTEQGDVEKVAVDYFKDLFSSAQPVGIEEVLEAVRPKVTDEMNMGLTRVFSEEEVKCTLFQMHLTKASGSYGKPTIFSQKFWSVVGKDVRRAVLGILNGDQDVATLNETFVVLIPKMKRSGRNSKMALKIDMSKAYDRVEWVLLENLMLKLGFDQKFTALVLRWFSSVSFSVLINGIPSQKFGATRGLRQGDPISPHLSIICAEAFSALLSNAEAQNLINDIAICRAGPRLSNLFFADDSLLFTCANMEKVQVLTHIFYEQASGEKINLDKSTMFFSKSVHEDRRLAIKACLDVGSMALNG
ncbi:uncharacterized protein LOC114312309 [Camellia sinensis]|uniref:uncharacterized protein LOC114312309 n=1 Tax=Camellia sinensis TaxID=4442 RepID=UPI001036B9EE|nr:uncharacterized protein LOC114312309 [Camellia sinensis]